MISLCNKNDAVILCEQRISQVPEYTSARSVSLVFLCLGYNLRNNCAYSVHSPIKTVFSLCNDSAPVFEITFTT